MADEPVFRPQRKKVTQEDVQAAPPQENPLHSIQEVREAVAREMGTDKPMDITSQTPLNNPDAPFKVQGNPPPQFLEQLQQRASGQQPSPTQLPPHIQEQQLRQQMQQSQQRRMGSSSKSDELMNVLERVNSFTHAWERLELPSKGKFYKDIPGVLNVRPMTGEEEQILATPRHVKQGKAIDMIFRKVIQENINTDMLLSIDRTFLLIFLRGISYTPEYDVEIKCPSCQNRFSYTINLNDLNVDLCPDDFTPDKLTGILPTTGLSYTYRLATGQDELDISRYREVRIKKWGAQSEDDTLLYRTALLLENIENVSVTEELQMVLKSLPINDVSHLRNMINDPPFGVDTDVPMICAYCSEEFEIDLPLETNFFFPRKRKEELNEQV